MPNKEEWEKMSKDELEKKARDLGIAGHSSMKKEELVRALEKHGSEGSSMRGGDHSRNDKSDSKKGDRRD